MADDQDEIDWLLLDRERLRAVVVEVKWTRSPASARRLMDALRAKVRRIPALRTCDVTHVLVSRSGFGDKAVDADCRLISLKDEPAPGR